MLQLLPSGVCQPITYDRFPLILGRGTHPSASNVIDLSPFNALSHGVSRHHVLLRYEDSRLLATDLNSLNGTHLNNDPLEPQTDYELHNGDRLILGTLHIWVSFYSPC